MSQSQHNREQYQQTKSSPINLRVMPEQRNLIDKAASVLNKTRSDFMMEAACQEAENVLLDRRLFLVDDETYEKFDQILNLSATDNKALLVLMEHKAPWEK